MKRITYVFGTLWNILEQPSLRWEFFTHAAKPEKILRDFLLGKMGKLSTPGVTRVSFQLLGGRRYDITN